MINYVVTFDKTTSDELKSFIAGIDDITYLNEVGARGAVNSAKIWQKEFNRAGGWKGSRYLGKSHVNKDSAWNPSAIAEGWFTYSFDNDGAIIANGSGLYPHKVRGGVIRAKKAEFLTIPLILEAKGRRAADYVAYSSNKLFKIGDKKVLFEKTDTGIRGVYALKKSVTQKPMPDAIPSEDVVFEGFLTEWIHGLKEKIKQELQ